MTNILPVAQLPLGTVAYQRFDDVQPFSIRSHASYENIQWEIVCWMRDTLTPFLSNESLAVATLQEMVNTMTADILAQGNVNDVVMIAVLQNAASQTREWLDARYLQTGNLDTALDNLLIGTGASAARSWFDSRYLRTAPNGLNVVDGKFHPEDRGAKFDGTDDRSYIQGCIDAAHALWVTSGAVQSVYLKAMAMIAATNYYDTANAQQGLCGLVLKSGVLIEGPGGVTLLPNQYGTGAQFSLIRGDAAGIQHSELRGITINGNRSHQTASQQANNAYVIATNDVRYTNVKSYEANGNSLMIVGTTSAFAQHVAINDCHVSGANFIGIQASQFNGLRIDGNLIEGCTDNDIDVYGEDGDTSSHGQNFAITNNDCDGGATGIFLETVAYGLVTGNRVSNAQVGTRVNRINGVPTSLGIRSNSFFGCPIGAAFSGDMQDVQFSDNEVQGATTAGVQFDGLRTSGISGVGNHMTTTNPTGVPLFNETSYVSQMTGIAFTNTFTNTSAQVTFTNHGAAPTGCSIPAAIGPGFGI